MLACGNKCDIGFVNLRQSKSVSNFNSFKFQ